MEEKTLLQEEALESVSGGVGNGDYQPWRYDPVPLNIVDRKCPDCGEQMEDDPETYPELGYDIFMCINCRQFFMRKYFLDRWYRAYEND